LARPIAVEAADALGKLAGASHDPTVWTAYEFMLDAVDALDEDVVGHALRALDAVEDEATPELPFEVAKKEG
jgi:hypothetical protein